VFTGIVEAVGEVRRFEDRGDGARIQVFAPAVTDGVRIGDSVAVNGACLTVTARRDDVLDFDVVRETLDRTNLGSLGVGSRVNLERALRADGRLDGHLVQGHVDETGVVDRIERDGDDVRLFVDCDAGFARLLVEKGSVCIDGVSLTVVGVGARSFDVALIPHTLEVTTLGSLGPGGRVNLEADILGKYVVRYLERLGVSPRADGG